MLRKTNNIFLVFHILIVLFISASLFLSIKFQGLRRLIEKLTGENGAFEITVFFLLLMISTFAMLISFNNQGDKVFTKARRHFVSLIAICFYFAAMQEVRWGQLLSSKNNVAGSENLKGIVNLNRFIEVTYFNTITYLIILFGFILVPLTIYYGAIPFGNKPGLKRKATIYLPSLHCMLMFGFACGLYTLTSSVTNFDHLILSVIYIAIAGLLAFKKKLRSADNVLHFCLVGGSWLLFLMYSKDIPMGPEYFHLGKLVAVYAFFYWLFNWTTTLKERVNAKSGN